MNDLVNGVQYERIARLDATLATLPQLQIVMRHHFADGLYAREGLIPKGTVFVGRIHRRSQINIISKGDISVLTERGLVRMTAPYTMASPAGAQRAAYAHEDTVWTTILGTSMTDPEEIYETLTVATFEQYELVCREIMKLAG